MPVIRNRSFHWPHIKPTMSQRIEENDMSILDLKRQALALNKHYAKGRRRLENATHISLLNRDDLELAIKTMKNDIESRGAAS